MSPKLPAVGITASLSEDERELLSSYGEFIPLQDGKDLIVGGEPQDSLYILCEGALTISTRMLERRVALGEVAAGGCVGEVSMFDPTVASATVSGNGFCQVWRIDRGELEKFLNDNPTVAAKFLIAIAQQLGSRVRSANERLTTAKDAVPLLVERLKEAKEGILHAQEELPKIISML